MANLNTSDEAAKFTSLLFIEILTFLGNGIMIILGMRSSELRKYSNGFIFNMAVADLSQSIVVMPFALASILHGKWPFSSRMCTATGIIKVVITMASVQSLAGISLDRYFYIVKSRSAINSKNRVIISICLVWFVSVLLSISPLFGWGELGFHRGKEVCTMLFYKTISHTVVVFVIGLFIPVSIMAICYYRIFRVLRSQGLKLTKSRKVMAISSTNAELTSDNRNSIESGHEEKRVENKNGKRGFFDKETSPIAQAKLENDAKGQKLKNHIHTSRESKSGSNVKGIIDVNEGVKEKRKFTTKEMHLLRSVVLVMVVFISCWLPYVIFNLLRALNTVEESAKIDTITMWFGFANSALNPILYGLTNRQFRDAAKKTLKVDCRNR